MSAFVFKDTAENPATAISVGAAATEIVSASSGRDTLIIQNTHASQTLTVVLDRTAANGGTDSAPGVGLVIAAGAMLVLEGYRGYVNAYGSGAATTGTVVEF